MAYFPLFIELEGKKCLVVGGGRVAARKAAQLLAYGAELLVVAKAVCPAMWQLAGHIRLQLRPARVEDADGMDLVICASDDRRLHEELTAFCRERRIWVNVADDSGGSSFLFPGLVRQGDVVLGITTGGKSPAATRYLRRELEGCLPPFFGGLVERLGVLRDQVKELIPDPRERERRFTELLMAGIGRGGILPDEVIEETLRASGPGDLHGSGSGCAAIQKSPAADSISKRQEMR